MADLTIIMPTWNKEKYVAAALDSVFAQRTSHTFRVLVADDHSTDQTLEIVASYSARHPGVIEVLASDVNRKLYRNVLRAYAATKTPYFCVLDPDDYWISDTHVEDALSFLDAHPDFTVYSAGIRYLNPDGTTRSAGFPDREVVSDWTDFVNVRATVAFTQSSVFRNVVFAKGVPEAMLRPAYPTMERSFRGDSFRNFLHIREGKAYYSPKTDGCYRLTDEGIYAGGTDLKRLMINAQLYLDLWRYDGERSPGLLAYSCKLFRQAAALAPTVASVAPQACCSCGACGAVCPSGAVSAHYENGLFVPAIDPARCVDCGLCVRVCPQTVPGNSASGGGEPLATWTAHVREDGPRWRSASGGFVSRFLADLLAGGRYARAYVVAYEAFAGEQAALRAVTDAAGVYAAVKSKYVPVSVAGVVAAVRERRIARSIVVCTPCQLRAIRRAMAHYRVPEDDVLFVGLFCEQCFDYRIYDRYARDYGTYEKLHFKDKEPDGWPGHTTLVQNGRIRKVDQTVRGALKAELGMPACSACEDKLNRAADISVGDCYVAGYSRPDGVRGVSSVVVRTAKGASAFESCRDAFVLERCRYELVEFAQQVRSASRRASLADYSVRIDVYDFTNRGDWMMLEAILEQVRGRLPFARVSVPDAAYAQQRDWCDARGVVPASSVPAGDVDLVFFSPGFRFSDQFGDCPPQILRYYADYFGGFTARGRLVVFLPQAFGPFTRPSVRRSLKICFRFADLVYAREATSLAHLRRVFPRSRKIRRAPDFTCLLHAPSAPCPRDPGGYVVLIPNVNMVLHAEPSVAAAYRGFMSALARHLTERGEKAVWLNHEGKNDEPLFAELNAALGNPLAVESGLTGSGCKAVIGGAKLVITSRFHGLVSGLTEGVPTLCTSWSHKYGELLDELGCRGNLLDVNDLGAATAAVDAALADPSRFAPTPDRLEALRHEVYRMWDEIFDRFLSVRNASGRFLPWWKRAFVR